MRTLDELLGGAEIEGADVEPAQTYNFGGKLTARLTAEFLRFRSAISAIYPDPASRLNSAEVNSYTFMRRALIRRHILRVGILRLSGVPVFQAVIASHNWASLPDAVGPFDGLQMGRLPIVPASRLQVTISRYLLPTATSKSGRMLRFCNQ